MTPQDALERWEIHGDGPHLPQIYRDMGLTRLRILVAEEAKAADTISNVSELVDDYAREPAGKGDKVFERFNAPKAAIIANYLAVINVLIEKPLIKAGRDDTLVLDLSTLWDDLGKLQ